MSTGILVLVEEMTYLQDNDVETKDVKKKDMI